MKTKAVRIYGKKDLRLEEFELPEMKDDEILAQVISDSICMSSHKAALQGADHKRVPADIHIHPTIIGHEFSGIVVEKGKGTPRFKVGDAIMGVHSAPCLKCSYCRKGVFNLCDNLMSTKVLGAYAEYLLLPRHIVRQNVFKKPKTLSFSEAASSLAILTPPAMTPCVATAVSQRSTRSTMRCSTPPTHFPFTLATDPSRFSLLVGH